MMETSQWIITNSIPSYIIGPKGPLFVLLGYNQLPQTKKDPVHIQLLVVQPYLENTQPIDYCQPSTY